MCCMCVCVIRFVYTSPLSWQIQQTTNWRYFSYFTQKVGFEFMQIVSEGRQFVWIIRAYFFGEKKGKYFKMSSAENFYPTC